MTLEDVLRLKSEAKTAQLEADAASVKATTAKADADADPGDPIKAGAAAAASVTAVTAGVKAAEAWKVWNEAEIATPSVTPNDWRVILLGLYLIVMLLVGVYALSVLARAVPPEKATRAMRTTCCLEGNDCPTPSPTITSAPETNVNIAVNANATANFNSTNFNTNVNSSPANRTGSPSPTKSLSPVNTNVNTNLSLNNDVAQEKMIPTILCIEYLGQTSADGYLFLIVLFAGMIGATTRLVFSFVRHQGIRDFTLSWAWFYLFTPFSGATISLFLYCVIRGGFYGSAVGTALALNVFAFFALGTLSGLFAENAMQKLREVAEVLLAKVPEKTKNAEIPGD